MALDAFSNFAKATVSGGYDENATAFGLLESNDAARFPDTEVDGPFNVVWFNAEYVDPANDPNREIVRVTDHDGGDVSFTVIRGQEGTAATVKNLPGRTYKIVLSLTAKAMQDVDDELTSLSEDVAALDERLNTGELFLSAAGMWPSTTNGAAINTKVESSSNKQNVYLLDFADGATSLSAEASVVMPADWDGGTITAKFYWMVNSASTNSAVWQLKGRSYGDAETLDQSWGTPQSATDAGSGTANQVLKSAATLAITLAGTPAAGELVQFNVFRDPTNGSDNLAATARLLGVLITYGRQ